MGSRRQKKFYLKDPETGKKTDMYKALDGLGQLCMDKYGGRISTTVIQKYHPRFSGLFHTKDKVPVVLRLLKKINPRYGKIQYIPGKGGVEKRNTLNKEQEQILYTIMEENLDILVEGDPKSKKKLYREINSALIDAGSKKRTYSQVASLVVNRLGKGNSLPERLRNCKSGKIKDRLENRIEEIEKLEDCGLEGICRNIGDRRKDRDKINKYLPLGHQSLVLYLTDPQVSQEMFGEGTKPICVDVTEENTDPEIYEAFKGRLKDIETGIEDSGITDVLDGWLRFDILYKRPNGTYVIAEVKQRALDRIAKGEKKTKMLIDGEGNQVEQASSRGPQEPNFDNATKALKQIGGYSGMLTEIIRRKDFENRKDPNYVALKTPVEAHLVAYEIERPLFEFLNSREGRGAKVISRQVVKDYVAKAVSTRKQDKKPVKKVANIKQTPKIKIRTIPTEHDKRNEQFEVLHSELLNGIEGISMGTFNEKTGWLEFDGKVYDINGSRSHRKKIQDLVSKGIITIGPINQMKYQGKVVNA